MTPTPIIPWVLLIGGAATAHLRLLPPLAGFVTSAAAGPVGVALAVGLVGMRLRGTPVPHLAVLCLASLLPGLLLAVAGRNAFRYPRINDVTTDLDDPPQFAAIAALPENRGRNLNFPPTFAEVIRQCYPSLKPSSWPLDADHIFDTTVDVAEGQMNWTVLRADTTAREFEAVAESALFRFRDYVAVRVSKRDNEIVLDIRSKSRDGKSDLGVNAKRVHFFLDVVSEEITMRQAEGQGFSKRGS